jgi:hypothetical protein
MAAANPFGPAPITHALALIAHLDQYPRHTMEEGFLSRQTDTCAHAEATRARMIRRIAVRKKERLDFAIPAALWSSTKNEMIEGLVRRSS